MRVFFEGKKLKRHDECTLKQEDAVLGIRQRIKFAGAFMNPFKKSVHFFKVMCALICLVIVMPAHASWKTTNYSHFSKNEPLLPLIQDFSAAVDVPIVVSEKVRAAELPVFNGEISGNGLQVLRKLSRVYSLAWYYDNHMLYIYASDENKTSLIQMKNITPAMARESLQQAGVYDARYSWQPMIGAKSVIISGPPRYLELAEQVIKSYDSMAAKTEKNAHTVRVFVLNHAWAKDRVITSRGQTMSVPGVATSVQRILAREQNPFFLAEDGQHVPDSWKYQSSSFEESKNGATGVALKGEGIGGKGFGAKEPMDKAKRVISSPASASSYVEASPQQNAVIVYDLESRMPLYESLIKALDIPTDQVEIEVSIIDVKTNRLSELGIAWQTSGSDGRGGFGQASEIFSQNAGANAVLGDNVSLSTVLSGQVDYFLGKVKALAQDGDGQILSQPTVLTLDNQEALIDNSSTFFVRLQGQEEVDLIPITTGSILRVTPRIMDEQQRISLSVDISDGERNQASDVDNIPSISNSHINTQAIVDASASLLVGGYYYDQQTSGQDKVPILGDIPGLKYLFSNSKKSRVKVARLFLISPRIISKDPEQTLMAKSKRLKDMVEREKSFYDTKYTEPKLSIFD